MPTFNVGDVLTAANLNMMASLEQNETVTGQWTFNSTIMVNSGIGALSGGFIGFYTGSISAERMRLSVNGFLGIQTTNPLYALQIGDTSGGLSIGGTPVSNGQGTIKFINCSSLKNWQISTNLVNSGALEFTQSTSLGGAVFTTPALILDSSGLLQSQSSVNSNNFLWKTSSYTLGMLGYNNSYPETGLVTICGSGQPIIRLHGVTGQIELGPPSTTPPFILANPYGSGATVSKLSADMTDGYHVSATSSGTIPLTGVINPLLNAGQINGSIYGTTQIRTILASDTVPFITVGSQKLSFTNVLIDTLSEYNVTSKTFKVQSSGAYLITARVVLLSLSTNKFMTFGLAYDTGGAPLLSNFTTNMSSADDIRLDMTGIVQLSRLNQYGLYVGHNAPGTLIVDKGVAYTSTGFEMVRLW